MSDEAWNAEPAVLNELVGQGAKTPIAIIVVLADYVEDMVQNWHAFLVAQVRLALRTVTAFTRLASQERSFDAFDGEVARVELRT